MPHTSRVTYFLTQGDHAKKVFEILMTLNTLIKTYHYCSFAHQCRGILSCLVTVVLPMS